MKLSQHFEMIQPVVWNISQVQSSAGLMHCIFFSSKMCFFKFFWRAAKRHAEGVIKQNEKIFPKIKNLSKIEEKMSRVNDNSLKSSLNNFLKAFNERNK